MIRVTFMRFSEDDGPNAVENFDSIQVTYDLLRDDNDRTVAKYLREQGWERTADGIVYSDFTVESAES